MSITIHCPFCETLLTLPEVLIAAQAKCPSCLHAFTTPDKPPFALMVEVALPVEPEEQVRAELPVARIVPSYPPVQAKPAPEPEAPAETGFDWRTVESNRTGPRASAQAWQWPRAGLWTFFSLFVVLTVSLVVHLVLQMFRSDLLESILDQPMVLYVSHVVAWSAFLFGLTLCCATPSASRALSTIVGSLILTLLALGTMAFIIFQTSLSESLLALDLRELRESELFWFGALALLVAALLFVLYLRGVASYFHNQAIAENLIAVIVLVLISPVVMIVLDLLRENLTDFDNLFRLLKPTYLIGLMVWIALTLWSLIATLDSRTTRDEPEPNGG